MEKWLNAFTGHNLSVFGVMQGKITYNECNDLDIKALGKNEAELSRIELLVDIYYPSTRKAYDEIMAGRASVDEIATAHKRAYQRGESDGRSFLKPHVEAQKAVEAAAEVFKSELTRAIRAI